MVAVREAGMERVVRVTEGVVVGRDWVGRGWVVAGWVAELGESLVGMEVGVWVVGVEGAGVVAATVEGVVKGLVGGVGERERVVGGLGEGREWVVVVMGRAVEMVVVEVVGWGAVREGGWEGGRGDGGMETAGAAGAVRAGGGLGEGKGGAETEKVVMEREGGGWGGAGLGEGRAVCREGIDDIVFELQSLVQHERAGCMCTEG